MSTCARDKTILTDFHLDILLASETFHREELHENTKLQHISHHSPRRDSARKYRSNRENTEHHVRTEYKQDNVRGL